MTTCVTKIGLSESRNMIIVSLILVFAIGGMNFDFGGVAFSGIGLGAITGILLNLILPHPPSEQEPDLEEAVPPMEPEAEL
jgi:uracil permease